ncbi:MAG: lipoyl synthase [Chloroflexota bacterium]
MDSETVTVNSRHPLWLHKKGTPPAVLARMKELLDGLALHTVCEGAQCPNQGECFARGTATFLILGDTCTRHCRFCAVKKGTPRVLDAEEPHHVAQAAAHLKLGHVVITSVTRDDLPDGGAGHFALTVAAVREILPQAVIEVLTPDFQGSEEALKILLSSSPDIVNHNLETVPRLYPEVRPQADYRRSLEVLWQVKSLDEAMVTKSGLMLGLGEKREEVVEVMRDLRQVGCDLLTLGQYLPPSPQHIPLSRYVTPLEFQELGRIAKEMGFRSVASGPFVRSSFHAAELFRQAI